MLNKPYFLHNGVDKVPAALGCGSLVKRAPKLCGKLKFVVSFSRRIPYLWQKAGFGVPVVRSGCNFAYSYVYFAGAPDYRVAVVAGSEGGGS